jgi:hypothetical protein
MRYGHVTNGVIDSGPGSLPSSWENISGLNNLTNEELRPLGWLPWVFITVPVGENQVLDGSTIVINPDDIVETQIVRDMTPSEIQARDQQEMDSNKQQAEARLYETDWTTIPDVSDPAISDPYLTNAAEFAAYRSNVRKIAVNPPVTVGTCPVQPEEVWAYNNA